jgi:hypothetical protein
VGEVKELTKGRSNNEEGGVSGHDLILAAEAPGKYLSSNTALSEITIFLVTGL